MKALEEKKNNLYLQKRKVLLKIACSRTLKFAIWLNSSTLGSSRLCQVSWAVLYSLSHYYLADGVGAFVLRSADVQGFSVLRGSTNHSSRRHLSVLGWHPLQVASRQYLTHTNTCLIMHSKPTIFCTKNFKFFTVWRFLICTFRTVWLSVCVFLYKAVSVAFMNRFAWNLEPKYLAPQRMVMNFETSFLFTISNIKFKIADAVVSYLKKYL